MVLGSKSRVCIFYLRVKQMGWSKKIRTFWHSKNCSKIIFQEHFESIITLRNYNSFYFVGQNSGFNSWLHFVYRVTLMSFSGAKAFKSFLKYCCGNIVRTWMYQFLYQGDKWVLDFKDVLSKSLDGDEIKLPSCDLFQSLKLYFILWK